MRSTILAVAAVAALSVAGCSPRAGDGSTVAARVAGRSITVAELEAEMRVTGVAKPEDPQVRRAALERLIVRKLLARAAREDGLSTTPDARRARDIAREDFDATLERTLTLNKVATPTDAEAAAYVASHPESFSGRTIYLLDQIQTASAPDVAVLRALGPTKTLDEAEGVLIDRKVSYRRAPAAIDTLRAPPGLSVILAKLPAGEVFILPEGGGVSISRVRASEVQPVTGPGATAFVKQLLMTRRQNEALTRRVETLKAEQVTYGEGFSPAKK